jgi:microcystin-dependent protein
MADDVSQYVGEIRMVAFNFAPNGWALCNGQLLPIAQNTMLFAILGTTYGGDGKSTFALPDLRDRSPINQGEGAGLTARIAGETGGAASVTLNELEVPLHTHTPPAVAANATVGSYADGVGRILAQAGGLRTTPQMYSTSAGASTMAGDSLFGGGAGAQTAHNNMPPYLAVYFIIALQGTFPERT